MLSSSKLDVPASNSQLQSTSSVVTSAQSLLASCPTQIYNIMTHPNAHASDLRDPITGSCRAKSLCANNSTRIQTTVGVAEVVGDVIDAQALRTYIEQACGKVGREAVVTVSQLDALPGRGDASRGSMMAVTDKQIGAFVDSYDTNGQDFTVLYFASPHEPPRNYESDFVDTTPMELRRRMDGGMLERADGVSGNASLPLFAKYQFFTPGLFMAFLGAVIMFAMLYAGLSAVASLEVSYGAFDKEMGPAAQKKAQ
ncbi:hypothetical protein N0V93_006771 [Gnomoniopsis smithogilvyi]|uniref:Protein BIG1 n=1 Tax=Gnomoniopsis smithogilvyi TaxID=1191159 RepID=A0A9W8YP88_9PEZI|nr:hypothetical protein N0V93_006771 [Gnomoniopsis smithogilvyi]